MKHAAFIANCDDSDLKEKVEQWIKENEDNILEIVNIEYSQRNNMCMASITYID